MNLPLLKRGSVKNLRGPLPGGNEIIFEFTDDFSVFDWGKMPDPIPGKGRALLDLAAHLFRELTHPRSWREFFRSEEAALFQDGLRDSPLRRELESVGMRSCFRGIYPGPGGEPAGLIVERLEILPPSEIPTSAGVHYEYGNVERNRRGALIPLEVVFRHALTDKSSFFERNLETTLKPGHRFTTPLIEMFTKLEPTDRFISTPEEARVVGRVSEEIRQELELRTSLLSLWLKRACARRDLELIDGKFEWGLDHEGRVMLADAIGPDELRLVEKRRGFPNTRLSKEFLREYYRDDPWFHEISAKKKEADLAPGWQRTIQAPVPRLPAEALRRATGLYRSLERRFRPATVLLLGSGAREHAIAHRLCDSPNLRTLIWAPAQDAGIANLEAQFGAEKGAGKKIIRWRDGNYSASTADSLIARAREAGVTLVVMSQDADLEAGAADRFRAAGFSVFGPSREAARVEWSKSFTKELCAVTGVVTARAYTANSREEVERILNELPWAGGAGYVVKADGLAAGKGVILAATLPEAIAGTAELARYGGKFLVEERLSGEESSWFAFADGESFSLLDPAKDYKRLGEDQTGPNTGGMGAISPAPGTTPEFRERVRAEVFAPILAELRKRGIEYRGLLYAGLMTDRSATPEKIALLEFNARFGDPETQALLPRFEGDLLEWLGAVAEGTLADYPRDVPFSKDFAVYVVAASAGYPGEVKTGTKVALDQATLTSDAYRYAGLRAEKDGWAVSGGRVLGALGRGPSAEHARAEAYARLEKVLFPGAQIRKDVGL